MSGLPPGWVRAALGDVAQMIRGVTYRKGDSSTAPGSDLVPLLTATNIGRELDISAGLTYVPRSAVRPEQWLAVGDIVVATSSGSVSGVGKSALLAHDWEGTFGAFCAVVRPESGIDPRYLSLYLSSKEVRRTWSARAAGTNINNLKRDDVASQPVLLPPLAEQGRIVAAIEEQFSRLDAGCSLVRAGRSRLTVLRRSALSRAVGEGEEAVLGDLLDRIEAGKSFGGPGRPAEHDEWGVIKVSAMTWGAFRAGENKVVPAELVDPRWEVKSRDLLLSRANTTEHVGAPVLVRDTRPRLILSDKSLRLVVKHDVDKEWLLYALAAPATRQQISAVATGTSDSMRNISQEKLRAVQLRVPDPDRQPGIAEEIAALLSRIDRLDASVADAWRKSESLRSSILARAFRGELVPQDPNDEPASVLLERIVAERAAAPPRRNPARSRV